MKKIYDNVNIYGNFINTEPVGYCHCLTHRGSLTVSNMKKHKCLAKGCPFFKKNEMNQYWQQRRINKQKAKRYKKKLNAVYA